MTGVLEGGFKNKTTCSSCSSAFRGIRILLKIKNITNTKITSDSSKKTKASSENSLLCVTTHQESVSVAGGCANTNSFLHLQENLAHHRAHLRLGVPRHTENRVEVSSSSAYCG